MRFKIFLTAALLLLIAGGIYFIQGKKQPSVPPAHLMELEEEEKLPAAFIEARLKYEFDMLKDPATG